MALHPVLERPVQYLPGVGPRRAQILKKKWGIVTLVDLLELVPRTYRDYSALRSIAAISHQDEELTLRVRVESQLERRPRKGLVVTRLTVGDGTGQVICTWFNQPWITRQLPVGTTVIVSGRPERRGGAWEFVGPEYEIEDEDRDLIHVGRIVPVYPLTEGLGAREMRRLMKTAVDTGAALMPEAVPPRFLAQPAAAAWHGIHFPADEADLARSRRTLAFTELFILQLGLLRQKLRAAAAAGVAHQPDGALIRSFLDSLTFALTSAQKRVMAQITTDMESQKPMSRLVQGDVGSGKTIVAAAALVKAVESGHQGAMMAPTEILAEQHFINLRRLFDPLGVAVVLLTGRLGKKQRELALAALAGGRAKIAVGTHALLEDWVQFQDLSLVITDEQHRFGVRQRATLKAKAGTASPDVLVMTATPIPRTLALTLYGDLDVSIIDELPPGRQPIVTYWMKPAQRRRIYDRAVARFVESGQQGYVIAPLVAESDQLQVRAATELSQELQGWYPGLQIGLLHGKMRPDEKDAVMGSFRAGDVQILVATTVVEVGVDVPNASFIIIEEADRFGLTQLHQLRGRVGRGPWESFCILIADAKTAEAHDRLTALTRYSSGFDIAEADLKLRGPGQLVGVLQSGYVRDALFKVTNPLRDLDLLETARGAAEAVLAADPQLHQPEHAELQAELRRRLPQLAAGLGIG